LREDRKETERLFRELRKETEAIVKENAAIVKENAASIKETDKMIKNLGKQFGDLGNRFGELSEHLVAPNIVEKMNALGYNFTNDSKRECFRDAGGQIIAEVDILLTNLDCIMAVEIKAEPTVEHVREHVKRMEVLRRYFDGHNDSRRLMGMIAGAIMQSQVKRFAQKSGFYVIVQTGDTMKIDVPKGFKPREW
jgi:hypothetical protein